MLRTRFWKAVALAAGLLALPVEAQAEGWVVAKSTGQVWVANAKATPVALDAQATLSAGDLIQTGPNGRALLTRGQERVLVGPNSVLSLPEKDAASGFTKILQRAGSIAIEAEKKDHQHFEVETPYLAAVVKGTSFTVTVASGSADVQVSTGKVEVSDNRTGKIALVLPGQSAHTSASGFNVRGPGALEPIRQGQPRSAGLAPIQVPRQGLRTAPRGLGNFARVDALKANGLNAPRDSVRLTRAIGAAKLDVSSATFGLARGDASTPSSNRKANATIWSASDADTSKSSGNSGTGSGNGAGNGNGNGSGTSSSANSSNGIGNGLALGAGNGNSGSNGNAAGASNGNGNGHAYGLVNGGNGASVNGHASANGVLHSKKK
ncbi:MAG: FecR family protein [Hyphomicrobiaceae bacterium]|nr:FecR family protein [Hyphomicrobiaceae bacterium]